jgi:DNA (cytosine-5)-methyltransferase 1
LSEGLEEAGFKCVFSSEILPGYASAYRLNHPDARLEVADIRSLDPDQIRKDLGMEKEELDLMAGGPPCQGFSINAPIRSALDARNHLFKEFLRFVDAFAPRAVLIENVPGLVSFENGATIKAILESLEEMGYCCDVRILGAVHYGVPQTRWRAIVLGGRGKSIGFPEPAYNVPHVPNFISVLNGKSLLQKPGPNANPNYVTVKDAIGDLPQLSNGERGAQAKAYALEPQCEFQRQLRIGSSAVFNHEAPRLSDINMKRLQYIKPGGNWTDIPEELLPEGMKKARKSDHTKRYGRVIPDGLASTILTKCDPHWGAFFHYSQERAFTVREAARIQSFPDRYVFAGTQAQQFAQVGNAVPPLLAKSIGMAIKDGYLRE